MHLLTIPRTLRSFWGMLANRALWTGFAILVQLVILIVIIQRFRQQSIYIEGVFIFISFCIVLWILNSRRPPAFQMAWIIPILAFPVAGGLIYLILGGNTPKPLAQRKMQAIRDNLNELADLQIYAEDVRSQLYKKNPAYGNLSTYLERYALLPPITHTRSMYFPSGEAMFEQLLLELKKAKRYIFMEYFIINDGYMWNSILKVLKAKAAEGVDVRLIYDDIGTINRLPANYPDQLAAYGIKCKVFGPVHPVLSIRFNNRDHRKITVIDGDVAFTGGANLADEYINHLHLFGYWKDSAIMLYGDAAYSFAQMFLSMWGYLADSDEDPVAFLGEKPERLPNDGIVQIMGDSPLTKEPVSENTLRNLLGAATKSVTICTPYLVASNEMLTAIENCAKRGVEVHLITPGRSDGKWYVQSLGRASYQELLEAGVHVYEYMPGFIHSKLALFDDEVAFVGTVNLDFRSMYLHFECGAILYYCSSVQAIKHDMEDMLKHYVREITLEEMQQVSMPRRIGRSILKVFAPLM